MDLLCYWWQNSQCGIRTLSSDNVPESQHGAAFTGGGHTLLSVLPWAKPAEELVINRGTTSGCYCFPDWWRKNIIVEWPLWWCVCVWEGVQKCSPLLLSVCDYFFFNYSPYLCSIWAFRLLSVCSPVSHGLYTSFSRQYPLARLFKASSYLLFLAISGVASVPQCCHGKTIECKSSNLLNVH